MKLKEFVSQKRAPCGKCPYTLRLIHQPLPAVQTGRLQSLQEGKKVWLLARLPREYIIAGERISPYLVFSNTHDGSGCCV